MKGAEAGKTFDNVEDIDQSVVDEGKEDPCMEQADPGACPEDWPLKKNIDRDRNDPMEEPFPPWPPLSPSDGSDDASDSARRKEK